MNTLSSPRSLQRRSTKLLVPTFLLLFAACTTDAPLGAPPAASPISATSAPYAGQQLSTLAASLDRELAQDPHGDRVVSSFRTSDGRTGTTTLGQLRERVRQLSKPLSPTTFAIPLDTSARLALGQPSSIVQAVGKQFLFFSLTTVNKMDAVNFSHVASRSVATTGAGGQAGIPVWSQRDSAAAWSLPGGLFVTTWDPYTVLSGCAFTGTLSTAHKASWPAGATAGYLSQTVRATSGGSANMVHPCPPGPPPPPPEDPNSGKCEDANVAGCNSQGNSGFGYSGSIPITRTFGSTATYKTVCLVTDWYENGIYIETVIDRCWQEPL